MTTHYITDGGPDHNPSEQAEMFTYKIDEAELPSEAVIRAVAAVTNTSVLDLESLYDTVDPNHLDETVKKTDTAISTQLSFRFHGCTVTVSRDEVSVYEAEAESET